MNCIAQALATVLECDPTVIYDGVGHREPIHISELVAWLLTQGYALVPQETPMLTQFTGVVEGVSKNNEPHMVPLNDIKHLKEVQIIWYLIPIEINQKYCREFERKRDATKTFRVGVPAE